MNTTNSLLQFIKKATSPYHVVKEGITLLEKHGFEKLDLKTPWTLQKGGCYYTAPYDTCLFAFIIGGGIDHTPSFRIGASHTDHPGFRIKPNADLSEKIYCKLNTETYGGPILNTWLDRPLSIAGKVSLRSSHPFSPETKLIDLQKPLLTIPNLAIHLNKTINQGTELNKQTDLCPLFSIKDMKEENDKDIFLSYLSRQMNTTKDHILDYDLYIYNAEEGCLLGAYDDFISSPRLDNLTSVYALLESLISCSCQNQVSKKHISLAACYDNEEIGSRSKQGADSMITSIILKKIYQGLHLSNDNFINSVMDSFCISADVAHGLHPNYVSKYDPTNIALLNNGVVLKLNYNQKYATDTEAIAAIQQICHSGNIKYQKFVNRSDQPGGGTLGSILSSWLPIKTADLGVPLLAMHSARELMGIKDQEALSALMRTFFML